MQADSEKHEKSGDLAKSYEFHDVEQKWALIWEEQKSFRATMTPGKPSFSIVIPPPNVTGVLHVGHALNNTLQDILVRYRRMQGFNTLWVPGTDHAGIATQNVVERQLSAEGTDRHVIGRGNFVKRVWQWKEQYGGQIIRQLRRLGCSCDWERERFTMDEGLSRAVREVFCRLYKQGLIYQGDYIINWCPRCHTALADLEVEHEPTAGKLYHIRYPLASGSGYVVVATTRPETMLGDTAVAVHPMDSRYNSLPEKTVILPLMNRIIPIVFDDMVEMEFGTGALKVTPAHDLNDFEIGRRHNLPSLKVMNNRGGMNEEAGPYAGLDRFVCRDKIVADLASIGLLDKVEDYQHGVGRCYRCQTVVEPNLSRQWFVSVKPLAERAIRAVQDGDTRLWPPSWDKTYFEWMNNIRDWCISRQIWWGHQIPAWTCAMCGELVVQMEAPEICPECGGRSLNQESDVLDTWFSSALWPFSTLGWPDKTPELACFYPTSVLITSFDILFFWVARMMMMGLHFMDRTPFRDVYLHALVRDAEGHKMSKSRGNVLDPLLLMDQYGTDALRFTLAAFAAQGRDIRLSEERIEGYRHFINKIWNASRFCLMHLKDFVPKSAESLDQATLSLHHCWILSRTNQTVSAVIIALDEFRFNDAASAIYQFVWREFCDWYLEWIKPELYGEDGPAKDDTKAVLLLVLENIIKLLNPITPFVTEEIWSFLPGERKSLIREPFPTPNDAWEDKEAEAGMNLLMGVIAGLRNIRGEVGIHPSAHLQALVLCPHEERLVVLRDFEGSITALARLDSLTIMKDGARPKGAASYIYEDLEIFVPLAGLVDIDNELAKLEKERGKVAEQVDRTKAKLANEKFVANAPPEVVDKEREKLGGLIARIEKIDANVIRLREISGKD